MGLLMPDRCLGRRAGLAFIVKDGGMEAVDLVQVTGVPDRFDPLANNVGGIWHRMAPLTIHHSQFTIYHSASSFPKRLFPNSPLPSPQRRNIFFR